MEWYCDFARFGGMYILAVGTDLCFKYPSVCKDYLLHLDWFFRHVVFLLANIVYHRIRIKSIRIIKNTKKDDVCGSCCRCGQCE